MNSKATVFTVLVLVAALSRLFPHYPNFTAMGALAFYTAFSGKKVGQSFGIDGRNYDGYRFDFE